MIKEQLEVSELQKQNLKVNGFCNIASHIFEYNGKNIFVKSISNVDGMLKVIAECDGITDDYNYKNPPILVPDGMFHDEIVEGKVIHVPNYKEDLLEALHTILGDVITK